MNIMLMVLGCVALCVGIFYYARIFTEQNQSRIPKLAMQVMFAIPVGIINIITAGLI